MKYVNRFLIAIFFVLIPFNIASAGFDKASYESGDVMIYTSTGDEEYMYIWFGTDSLLYNNNCSNDTSGIPTQLIPTADGGAHSCAFDGGSNPSPPPTSATSTGVGGSIVLSDLPLGTYYFLEPDPLNTCDVTSGDTYSICEAQGDYVEIGTFTIVEVSSSGDFGDLVANAQEAYENTVGFTMASTTEWSGDTLIKPIMGGGLAVLYEIRYWMIALISISIMVFFAYKAMHMYFQTKYSKKHMTKTGGFKKKGPRDTKPKVKRNKGKRKG